MHLDIFVKAQGHYDATFERLLPHLVEETGRTQYKLSKDGNLLPSNFHIIIENRSHPFCSHSGAKEEKLVPLF